MDGCLIKVMWRNSIHCYRIKRKIMTFVDGFNGIVGTGWDEESQKWMRCKSNDGARFEDMRDKSKPIVEKGI